MSKILYSCLILSMLIFSSSTYSGSTTAPVVLAGSIIKTKNLTENTKKYKRSACPVCKGKGWYISGDGIKKVDCGYCEPDPKSHMQNQGCETSILKR